MKLLSASQNSRIYYSNDLYEAFKFAIEFNGQFISDYEASLEGVYYVII